MKFYSTRKKAPIASFRDALFNGQATDGGLYMPDSFPSIESEEIKNLAGAPYKQVAQFVAEQMLSSEISAGDLGKIINEAYPFAPLLKPITESTYSLELFHGPTLSFKDFGAQFMAQAMGHFASERSRGSTILVATSGDTGSAVAYAYYRVPGIQVVILYPSGKVSALQEKQLTTLGDNIQSLEIQGTFDDCQALVKTAFSDKELKRKANLTSANSINIGRLIPQSFYYFWSISQLYSRTGSPALVCVPSGNFGNMTAGLFAKKMGLPVEKYIAAVNSNAVIPEYLNTGEYQPRPSTATLSNAMDVGAPSNWERVRDLYSDNYKLIKEHLWSTSVNDEITTAAMRRAYYKHEYIADPHTSVGLEGLERYRTEFPNLEETAGVVLSTAHPGKFQDLINQTLNLNIDLPEQLKVLLDKEPRSLSMPNDYEQFKDFIWSNT